MSYPTGAGHEIETLSAFVQVPTFTTSVLRSGSWARGQFSDNFETFIAALHRNLHGVARLEVANCSNKPSCTLNCRTVNRNNDVACPQTSGVRRRPNIHISNDCTDTAVDALVESNPKKSLFSLLASRLLTKLLKNRQRFVNRNRKANI